MYQCNMCLKSYIWEDGLRRHMKTKHTMERTSNPEINPENQSSCESSKQSLTISNKPIIFQHPFTMTISGPTGSGKTMFLKELLYKGKLSPTPDRIVYLYKRWQPLYDQMQEFIANIEFIRGIPKNLDEDSFFDVKKNNIIICDDMMSMTAVDPKIADLYTEGSHHRNLSVINLTQNLFPPGKNAVTQRRNTQYMIIFKSPMSQDQILTLGTFMFPGRLNDFLQIYDEAVENPFGYLVIDAKQTTPNSERFKSDIFTKRQHVTETQFNDDSASVFNESDDGACVYCGSCKFIHENKNIFDKHICSQNEADDLGIKQEFISNTDHLDINLTEDNMAENNYPCAECGALYNSPSMLFKHIKQCGDNDRTEDVWQRMMLEVFADNEEEYNRKIEEYADFDDSEERAKRDMREVYKKDLKTVFKKYFIFVHLLEKSELYDQILGDFNAYKLEKHFSQEKALKTAIRKNDSIFENIMDQYIDYENETDDESCVDE